MLVEPLTQIQNCGNPTNGNSCAPKAYPYGAIDRTHGELNDEVFGDPAQPVAASIPKNSGNGPKVLSLAPACKLATGNRATPANFKTAWPFKPAQSRKSHPRPVALGLRGPQTLRSDC